jgi:hypothetical protein
MEESPVHNNVADLDDACVNHVTDALDDAGCMCDVPVMAVSEPEPVCSFCSMKLGDDLLIEKTYSMLTGVAFYVFVGLAQTSLENGDFKRFRPYKFSMITNMQ